MISLNWLVSNHYTDEEIHRINFFLCWLDGYTIYVFYLEVNTIYLHSNSGKFLPNWTFNTLCENSFNLIPCAKTASISFLAPKLYYYCSFNANNQRELRITLCFYQCSCCCSTHLSQLQHKRILRKLSAATMWFFWYSSMSCPGTQCVQTFHITSCCNAQTIVASWNSGRKCTAISYRMSVIVGQWSFLRRACILDHIVM